MRKEDIHIGDVLRIREWDDMVEEFGYEFDDGDDIDCDKVFTSRMRYLCGQKFTVKEISDYDGFLSEEDVEVSVNSPLGRWVISADMLEPYWKETPVMPESSDGLFSYLMGAAEVQ